MQTRRFLLLTGAAFVACAPALAHPRHAVVEGPAGQESRCGR